MEKISIGVRLKNGHTYMGLCDETSLFVIRRCLGDGRGLIEFYVKDIRIQVPANYVAAIELKKLETNE